MYRDSRPTHFVEKPDCKEFHRPHCGRREAAALNAGIATEQNQIPSFLWAQGESPRRGKRGTSVGYITLFAQDGPTFS